MGDVQRVIDAIEDNGGMPSCTVRSADVAFVLDGIVLATDLDGDTIASMVEDEAHLSRCGDGLDSIVRSVILGMIADLANVEPHDMGEAIDAVRSCVARLL